MKKELEKIVEQAIAVLSSDSDVQKLFAAETGWLNDRLAIWGKQEWRIALIGITSSGKSTLINALLDDRLLPARVRPSSNSLVICRRGDEPRAVVHYETKPSVTLRGSGIAACISALADEKNNPNNEQGIKEIDLFWPHFRMGSDVALIDTPGLDAYLLDKHEELTMRQLLPTVDAVCFLTTAKANSDGRIAHYLDIINAHRKPLVLVQNMIDSVEAKLGDGGRVARSRHEVTEDHLLRLRKLLAKQGFDPQATPILQVSAQLALAGRLEESGIPQLIETLNAHLRLLEPRLSKGRFLQLYRELSRLVTRQSSASNPAVTKRQLDQEREELDRVEASLLRAKGAFTATLDAVAVSAGREAAELTRKAERVSDADIAGANALAEEVKAWFALGPAKLDDPASNFQRELAALARALNLTAEDLRRDALRGARGGRIQVPVTTKKVSVKVKKEGLWNATKRFFSFFTGSDSGYEWVDKPVDSVDLAAFQQMVTENLNKETAWLTKNIELLKANAETLGSPLKDELARRRKSHEAQLATRVAAERRAEIVARIAVLCKALKEKVAAFPHEEDPEGRSIEVFHEPEVTLELPSYLLDLVGLAHSLSHRRYHLLRQEMLQRITRRTGDSPARILIWGFDEESMDRFLSRFWSDLLSGSPGPVRDLQMIETSLGTVAVALDSAEGDKDVADLAQGFVRRDTACFVLLDLEQPGSTMTRLRQCGVLPVLAAASGLVLVVQGLKALENSGQVAAGIWELRRLAREFRLSPDGVLANDQKDFASALVDRLFLRGDELQTIEDERSWIADLGEDAGDYCGAILRGWREEIREAQGVHA